MESHWLENQKWQAYFTKLVPSSTLEKALYKAYVKHTKCSFYKCIYGTVCTNSACSHLHPSQDGYNQAAYYQSDKKCLFETELNACRLKCGSDNGRYCPYAHCKHGLCFNTIKCVFPDCQGHCNKCI